MLVECLANVVNGDSTLNQHGLDVSNLPGDVPYFLYYYIHKWCYIGRVFNVDYLTRNGSAMFNISQE